MTEAKAPSKVSVTEKVPELGIQRVMFPVEITDLIRNDLGTADLQIIGTAADGKDYAIKTIADGNGHIPCSELFCYELARELQIATPVYSIVKMPDSSLAFGSMWEGGAQTIKNDVEAMNVFMGKVPVRGLKRFLSRVYALDLFINNVDRHFGNYIFRSGHQGLIALAYDFSRAWYAFSPYGYESKEKPQKTQLCHEIIAKYGNFDPLLAKSTLDEISRITIEQIDQILVMLPDDWLKDDVKSEFRLWWVDGSMTSRVDELKRGIK